MEKNYQERLILSRIFVDSGDCFSPEFYQLKSRSKNRSAKQNAAEMAVVLTNSLKFSVFLSEFHYFYYSQIC